jgi:hypothetical protein
MDEIMAQLSNELNLEENTEDYNELRDHLDDKMKAYIGRLKSISFLTQLNTPIEIEPHEELYRQYTEFEHMGGKWWLSKIDENQGYTKDNITIDIDMLAELYSRDLKELADKINLYELLLLLSGEEREKEIPTKPEILDRLLKNHEFRVERPLEYDKKLENAIISYIGNKDLKSSLYIQYRIWIS